MPLWRFRNLTQDVLYEPILASVHISDSIPCGLKTFTCLIPDPNNELEFDERDENAVEYAIDDVNYVDLHAGDISAFRQTHLAKPSPRIWALTVQDYTARLDWTVIEDGNRTVRESVTARVNWIMGHAPTHDLTTGGVATIAATIEPFDYTNMTKREALDQVAGVVMALYYCAGKDLQFFLQDDPPSNPAPFALAYPENPPTSYTYHDFDLSIDPLSQVDEILARGDDVSVKRTRVGAPIASERRQRALNLPSIGNLSDLRAAADRELALYGEATRTGRLVTYQPGLEAAMTATIANSEWAINEGWVLTDVDIRPLTGNENPSAPGLAEFAIAFAKQFACRLGRSDQDRGDTLPDDCSTCARKVVLLDGMSENQVVASGVAPALYIGDGIDLAKYRCDLERIWQVTPDTWTPLLFDHEPGTHTPVQVGTTARRTDNGDERWDATVAGNVAKALASMATAKYWQVVDKAEGEITPVYWRGKSQNHVDYPSVVAVGGFLQPGDLAVVLAANSVSTAPTLASGWTERDHRDTGGGSTLVAFRYLVAGDTGTGNFGNVNSVTLGIYRGAATSSPLGNVAFRESLSNPKIPALSAGTAGSWILAFGVSSSNVFYAATAVGMTRRSGGFVADAPNGNDNAWMGDTAGPDSSYPETAIGSGVNRMWSVEVKVGSTGGGGGGVSGPALQKRDALTGDLISEVALDEASTQIRSTPNAEHLFVLIGTDTLERYGRDLSLEDTVTIAAFTTGLQEWMVDDDYNVYRLEANVLEKYNRDGELLWTRDLFAAEGYRFPSRAYGPTGHTMIFDGHIRIAGYTGGADWQTGGSIAVVLTVSPRLGAIEDVKQLKSDDAAQAITVHRFVNCLVATGAAEGTTFEDVALPAGVQGWAARLSPVI